jgi:hypothetical protein
VTHERLGDEVVAIAFDTGVYYSLRGVGADCWSLIADGHDTEGVVAGIVDRYEIDDETVRRDVEAFVVALTSEGLIEEADGEPAGRADGLGVRAPYAAPAFERFDDMRELLLLDPIHEVDAAGWPVPLSETA